MHRRKWLSLSARGKTFKSSEQRKAQEVIAEWLLQGNVPNDLRLSVVTSPCWWQCQRTSYSHPGVLTELWVRRQLASWTREQCHKDWHLAEKASSESSEKSHFKKVWFLRQGISEIAKQALMLKRFRISYRISAFFFFSSFLQFWRWGAMLTRLASNFICRWGWPDDIWTPDNPAPMPKCWKYR